MIFKAWKSVEKLLALVCLSAPWISWVRGGKHLTDPAVIALALLELTGIAQENVENTSITVSRYLIPPFWRWCAYWPGPPAIEHRYASHRCESLWTDGAPACASYKPACFVNFSGPFVLWQLRHGASWRVSQDAQHHFMNQSLWGCDKSYLKSRRTLAS